MYRVFLVTEGVPILEDTPPTASVLTLQSSLSRKCGVRPKDIILLTPKGHSLDSKETLGSYDAGTDEKPVFIFLRPDSLNKNSITYTPYRVNPTLGPKLDRLTSSPSSSALQHQLVLGDMLAEEAVKISNQIQELKIATRLQCMGWQALVNNFTSIHRVFEKHHRLFGWSLVNLQESRSSYEELLVKSPHQLETLKKINLAPSLAQGVFDGCSGSLYDWISSQDEHSSLLDLVKECREALKQINESLLSQLQLSASQLIAAADNLTKNDSVKGILRDIRIDDVLRVTQEQQSMAQSLQSTIQRALGSGDAGALANVSLSNQRLVQLMHNNHVMLETRLKDLEAMRQSIKEVVERGLGSVADVQQEMIESNTQLLFHSEHLQLTRRRFEVLEQICASPQTLAHVVFEIQQRKKFKKEYTEYAQRMAGRLEAFRQTEKLRRQKFLEAYSQHFLLSLFPSFTDRIPHFVNMTNHSFDDDLCHLSNEMLSDIERWLPQLTTPPTELVSLFCDDTSQTEHTVLDKPDSTKTDCESVGVQCSVKTSEMESQIEVALTLDGCVQTTEACRLEAESQTEFMGTDVSLQTLDAIMAEVGIQVKLRFGKDVYTQTDLKKETAVSCQTPSLTTNECSMQTVPLPASDVGLQIRLADGVDEYCQTLLPDFVDSEVQTSELVDLMKNVVDRLASTGSENILIDTGSQTILVKAVDSFVQTLSAQLSDCSSQTQSMGKDITIQTEQCGSQNIVADNSSQTLSTVLLENSSQTQPAMGNNRHSQTEPQLNSTIGLQTEYKDTYCNSTQTVPPNYPVAASQTNFIGQHQSSQTPLPLERSTKSSQTDKETGRVMQQNERREMDNASVLSPVLLRQTSDSTFWPVDKSSTSMYLDSQTDTVVVMSGSHSDAVETEPNATMSSTNSMTDLEGQVFALNAAVSGLKTQLMTERESHKKQMVNLEREMKRVQRSQSIGRDAEEILTITIGSLKVGDTALFLQDSNLNFLALTVDGRIYYLNHSSAETFKHDISLRIQGPLRRKAIIGVVTEKLLVEVRKESNRLRVPVGQRLYKLSARETPLPPVSANYSTTQ